MNKRSPLKFKALELKTAMATLTTVTLASLTAGAVIACAPQGNGSAPAVVPAPSAVSNSAIQSTVPLTAQQQQLQQTLLNYLAGTYQGTYQVFSRDPDTLEFTDTVQSQIGAQVSLSFISGNSNLTYAEISYGDSFGINFQSLASGVETGPQAGGLPFNPTVNSASYPNGAPAVVPAANQNGINSGEITYVFTTEPQNFPNLTHSFFRVELRLTLTSNNTFDQSRSGIRFLDCESSDIGACGSTLKEARFISGISKTH